MSTYAVWLDRETAKLFQFSPEKMERRVFHSSHSMGTVHASNSVSQVFREQKFYQEIASSLVDSGSLLILGPGVAKHHFQNFLNEHYPSIAKKIVGCETVDYPSDPQIAAYAYKYFSHSA